ncbi:MAG: molybdenum cofactor biosynthesis protein MoaE, partial [Chloroflexi bacterium]|nr:molybdenum cofactor biosynthesis protein MoaE [Chloroflexota bacterium]
LYEPLSLQRCVDAVRQPGSGGLVTFIGSVRDVSEGKKVRFLEYEAYEPMALEKLRQVVDEAAARWPVRAMAIQHRLGRLEIGEDAVIIAVSCPHRAEAFAACRYAIDRLKEIVPIWKKEYGEGGETWVGGPTLASASSSPVPAQD